MVAFYRIMHATDRKARKGRPGPITPASLRGMAATPATFSDLLEAWLMTRPKPSGGSGSTTLHNPSAADLRAALGRS